MFVGTFFRFKSVTCSKLSPAPGYTFGTPSLQLKAACPPEMLVS